MMTSHINAAQHFVFMTVSFKRATGRHRYGDDDDDDNTKSRSCVFCTAIECVQYGFDVCVFFCLSSS